MANRDSRLPFTVLMPEDRSDPIEIHDHLTSLRMSVIEKGTVGALDEDAWNVPGAYVLLDAPQPDGAFGVYVGKAPAGVKSRLMSHERQRDWARALLIQRENYTNLSSAQAGWLEGDLYDLFDASHRARLHNSNKPGDDTVPTYELRILESFRDPITRVLRLLGYDTSTEEEVHVEKSSRRKKTYTSHGVKFGDLLDAGLIAAGERLISVNGSWPASAVVLAGGMVGYDGKQFATPSAAAVAVKGGAANGWDFWAVERPDGSERLSAIRKQFQDQQASAQATTSPVVSAGEAHAGPVTSAAYGLPSQG